MAHQTGDNKQPTLAEVLPAGKISEQCIAGAPPDGETNDSLIMRQWLQLAWRTDYIGVLQCLFNKITAVNFSCDLVSYCI